MNWRVFPHGLDLLRRFPRPIWFRYTPESGETQEIQAGWLAQEIQPIAPWMVERGWKETDALSVNFIPLFAMLYNAVIELDARITALEAQRGNTEAKTKHEDDLSTGTKADLD